MEEEKQNSAESVQKKENNVQKTEKPKTQSKPKAEKTLTPAKQKNGSKIAVILIRGMLAKDKKIKDTLQMLNLHRKYNLVILDDNPVNEGMIFKVKDFTTFGEISEETIKAVDEKRPKGKNKYYSLPPPRGGLERKGSKKNFKDGGALGPRKEKINDLILRMI